MLMRIIEISFICPLLLLNGCSSFPDMLKIVADGINMEAHRKDDRQDIDIHISLDLDDEVIDEGNEVIRDLDAPNQLSCSSNIHPHV